MDKQETVGDVLVEMQHAIDLACDDIAAFYVAGWHARVNAMDYEYQRKAIDTLKGEK